MTDPTNSQSSQNNHVSSTHPIVSINGEILPKGSAFVSVFDRGFTRGDGLFETIKVQNYQPWYLDEHLQRMIDSSSVIGIECPSQLKSWVQNAISHAQKVKADVGVLRITLSRGVQELFSFSGDNHIKPTLVIVLYSTPDIPDSLYDDGISVEVSGIRRDPRNPTSYIKSLSYTDSIIAAQRARSNGFDDAILLNVDGFVAEGTASNVFVVIDDVIRTPGRIHGILPGVTRSVVMELAKELEIPLAERELSLEELLNSHEAFFTSSIRGIVPIVKIGDYNLGQGTPGTITKKIIATYNKLDTRQFPVKLV